MLLYILLTTFDNNISKKKNLMGSVVFIDIRVTSGM